MILTVVDRVIDNHIVKDDVIMLMKKVFERRIFFGLTVITMMMPALQPSASASSAHLTEVATMLPPPDVETAVRSEYAGVVKKGTREAYQRFIRRHPAHPLARKAREALAKGGLR